MEDSEEIDVLGDFDYKSSTDLSTENESGHLHDSSSQLSPEYSRHPWLLEQGWLLDQDIDESSRAVIENMLQEEQMYINGGVIKQEQSLSSKVPQPRPAKVGGRKSGWNEKERELFFQGLEIFGRRWSKVAELIPTKTHQQVKNFAIHHLRKKNPQNLNIAGKNEESPDAHCRTEGPLVSVSTGEPTFEVIPQRKRKHPKTTITTSTYPKNHDSAPSSSKGYNILKLDLAEIVHIRPQSNSESSDSDIDVEIDIDSDNVGTSDHDCTIPGNATVFDTSVDNDWPLGAEIRNHGRPDADTPDEKMTNLSELHRKNQKMSSLAGNTACSQTLDHLDDRDISLNNVMMEANQSNLLVQHDEIKCPHNIAEVDFKTHTIDTGSDGKKLKILNNDLIIENPEKDVGHSNTSQISNDHLSDTQNLVDSSSQSETKNILNDKVSALVTNIDDVKAVDAQSQHYEDIRSNLDSDTTYVQQNTSCSEEEEHADESDGQNAEGTIIYLSMPEGELLMNMQIYSEEEQEIHGEFFDGRPGMKTPDRYLKIRNHILECWEKCKPSYLNKTSVRNGLRNCGDVNCIGRIHFYLEQIGAINFGCAQVQYNQPLLASQPKPRLPKEKVSKDKQEAVSSLRTDTMRQRKRRVRDAFGDWVDERNLEGMTIDHANQTTEKTMKPKSAGSKQKYDPFRLVPCLPFNVQHPAPYSVTIETAALITMDVHAHLSKAEVIGLLGGSYNKSTKKLTVITAAPCKSLSTGMQCEMDPVSQTQACERIEAQGLSVIGWYHSHPVFAPNPSVRDIETQQDFQDWFSMGGNAFVGIIVSPYNRETSSLCSDIRCLIVNKNNPDGEALPYQFDYGIGDPNLTERHRDQLVDEIQSLAETYANYRSHIFLLDVFKFPGRTTQTTYLEKMLQSIESHMYRQDEKIIMETPLEDILLKIGEIFKQAYTKNSAVGDVT